MIIKIIFLVKGINKRNPIVSVKKPGTINNNAAIILVIVRKFVELLKRLNAAPLFFTRVNLNKLGKNTRNKGSM